MGNLNVMLGDSNNDNEFEVIEPLRTISLNDSIFGENQPSLSDSTKEFVSINNHF